MAMTDENVEPWDPGVPQELELLKPLPSTLSAPLRDLIERGLLHPSFEQRLDAEVAYEQALRNGAESAYEPIETTDERGTVVMSGIKTFGRVIHSLVSRTDRAIPHALLFCGRIWYALGVIVWDSALCGTRWSAAVSLTSP